MAGTYTYSPEQMIEALRQSRGLVSLAAEMMGCARQTVYEYMEAFPEIRQAREDARHGMLDVAEGMLFKKIQEGDMTAIIFYLKTQGKDRGYIERLDIGLEMGVLRDFLDTLQLMGIDKTQFIEQTTSRIRERKQLPAAN